MRTLLAIFLTSALLLGGFALLGQDKKPPEKITFVAKNGNVTFNHAAHIKRENGNCATCHPKLFPQDSKAALNFKPVCTSPLRPLIPPAEACHAPGGTAFETKGNCAKCHVKS